MKWVQFAFSARIASRLSTMASSNDGVSKMGGNYRDYKEYLDALQEKKSEAPPESAAKKELRRLVEKNIAVRNRIEAFSVKKIDALKGDTPKVQRTVSCKISERVSAIENVEKQQVPKVQVAKSAVAPRAMMFGAVSAYKQKVNRSASQVEESVDETDCKAMQFKMAEAMEEMTQKTDSDTEENEKMTDEKDSDSAVHVCFAEDIDGAGRKDSIGKYALTPMPSMEEPFKDVKEEEDEEEVPQQQKEESEDEGEYKKMSQELAGEIQGDKTPKSPETYPEIDDKDEDKSGIKVLSIDIPSDDEAEKKEVAETLKEFDEKLSLQDA